MTKLVLQPKTDPGWAAIGCIILGLALSYTALDTWQQPPYDYSGRRDAIFQTLGMTNQHIAIFVCLGALFFLLAGCVVLRNAGRPGLVFISDKEVAFPPFLRSRVYDWAMIGSVEEKDIRRMGRQLMFRRPNGRVVASLSIDQFEQSREEILDFLRRVRPTPPITTAS